VARSAGGIVLNKGKIFKMLSILNFHYNNPSVMAYAQLPLHRGALSPCNDRLFRQTVTTVADGGYFIAQKKIPTGQGRDFLCIKRGQEDGRCLIYSACFEYFLR
jgi:hypothetical protein